MVLGIMEMMTIIYNINIEKACYLLTMQLTLQRSAPDT